MNLTPEQVEQGRRNFLKVLAGTPALAALGASAAFHGPVPGGPVRVGFIGVGSQGRSLLGNVDPAYAELRALCDVNPKSLEAADQVLARGSWPAARHYTEWREMLQKEDLEAIIMAPPLWMHADIAVGCLDAGKHVLCEKMMAWDVAGCDRMREAAGRNRKVLEIGYQRLSSPMYQAAYDGIINTGTLGDVYHVRLAWHRNGSWRRKADPPSADYNPSKWGYPDFDHLLNWRLYWKYSQGLLAELCSHQINAVNWFLGSAPEAVMGAGGVYRFPEGNREVYDHVYATFEYPGGRTAMFSSIESNAFDDYYEMYMGTKGTLIMNREQDALLFEEGSAAQRAATVEVAPRAAGAPAAQTSETMAGNTRQGAAAAVAAPGAASSQPNVRVRGSRIMIQRFCSAVRVGTPLSCGADKAYDSARACIRGNEAIKQKARLSI
jgi:predicted dehydrogenase